jgi:hypothetical protein
LKVIDHETRGRFLARDLNVLSTGWMTAAAAAANDAVAVVMETEIGR